MILIVLLLWVYFFLPILAFVLQWLSLILDDQILVLIGMVLVIVWRMFHGRISLSASTAASEFCEWLQVGIDVYISHRKYHVKPHSSLWFSAACATAIVHRNLFFCLYQQNKSSESNVKFRQANKHCKRVLEATKLPYANKKWVHPSPETWLW